MAPMIEVIHLPQERAMFSSYTRWLAVGVVGIGLALPSLAGTAVRAQLERDVDPNNAIVYDAVFGTDFAEFGDPASAYARARASFGNHGSYATVPNADYWRSAYGESYWIDSFTLDSGVGTGVLDIRLELVGTLVDHIAPAHAGANAFYRLYASNEPIRCDFDRAQCTGQLLYEADGLQGRHVVSLALPFSYGESFYIASYLGAEALGFGTADFYGSAHFGATAPGGAALLGASGTTYLQAAAVPEPGGAWLMLAGLGLAACTTGHRHLRRRAG